MSPKEFAKALVFGVMFGAFMLGVGIVAATIARAVWKAADWAWR